MKNRQHEDLGPVLSSRYLCCARSPSRPTAGTWRDTAVLLACSHFFGAVSLASSQFTRTEKGCMWIFDQAQIVSRDGSEFAILEIGNIADFEEDAPAPCK